MQNAPEYSRTDTTTARGSTNIFRNKTELVARLHDAATQIKQIISEKPLDKTAYTLMMCRYTMILNELSATSPGTAPWRMERENLPDDLTNVWVQIRNLPRIMIPFSPGNCWRNTDLESRLEAMHLPEEAQIVGVISLILDRYVDCSFQIDKIHELFRVHVEQLSLIYSADRANYYQSVIDHALALARNDHLINTRLHKNTCTETGDTLAEPIPNTSGPSNKSHGRARDNDIERLGISVDLSTLARSIAAKWGTPIFDNIPQFDSEPKYTPPQRIEFEKHVNLILRSGKETMYSNAHLPGMEFTRDQLDAAITLAIEADENLSVDTRPVPLALTPLEWLISNPAFLKAKEDLSIQISLALESIAVVNRMNAILSADPTKLFEEAITIAREDVLIAREMVAEYQAVKANPPIDRNMVLRGVQRMEAIASDFPDEPDFMLALRVIDEKREKRESLKTMRPQADSGVPPAPIYYPEDGPKPASRGETLPYPLAEHEERAAVLPAPEAERPADDLPAVPSEGPFKPTEFFFNFGHRVLDEALEQYLPTKIDGRTGKVDERAANIRQTARTISFYLHTHATDEEVHPNYLTIVRYLRADPDRRTLVDLATDLVDMIYANRAAQAAQEPASPPPTVFPAPIVQVGPSAADIAEDEDTRPGVILATRVIGKLYPLERELINSVLGKEGDCNEMDLQEFMQMQPGVRDYRFQNVISSIWTTSDWRGSGNHQIGSDFDLYQRAKAHIYDVCGLRDANEHDRRQAALDPSNLTTSQLGYVANFFSVHPKAVTSKMIEEFGVWVKGDQAELLAYWDANKPDQIKLMDLAQKMLLQGTFSDEDIALLCIVLGKTKETLTALDTRSPAKVTSFAQDLNHRRTRWYNATDDERRNFWRSGVTDLLTVGDLVHKTLVSGKDFSTEELNLLCSIYKKSPELLTEVAVRRQSTLLAEALTVKFYGLPEKEGDEFENKLRGKGWNKQVDMASLSEKFTEMEWRHLVQIFQKPQYRITPDDLNSLRNAIAEHRNGPLKDMPLNFYNPELMALYPHAIDMEPDALLIAARNEAEFHTLVGYLGANLDVARGRVDDRNSLSSSKFLRVERISETDDPNAVEVTLEDETEKMLVNRSDIVTMNNEDYIHASKNGDSVTGAQVMLKSGEIIVLDAVFDGVGRHMDDHVASGIAREIFEIAAVAGWLKTPEDVRRMIILADMSIAMKQISEKKNLRIPIMENNMGTTAAIGYQLGTKFYGIHCGDSEFKITRNRDLVFSSVSHALVNVLLGKGIGLDKKTLPTITKVLNEPNISANFTQQSGGFSLWEGDAFKATSDGGIVSYAILRDGIVMVSGQGPPIMMEKLAVALNLGKYGHVVTGALGNNISQIHINNKQHGYSPFDLCATDQLLVCTDGLSPLCAHEIPIFFEKASGDPQETARMILSAAESRNPTFLKKSSETVCHCDPRPSRNDDRGLRFRLGIYGMPNLDKEAN